MPTALIVLIAIALTVDLCLLVVVLVLRARGVIIYPRTKFGPALVFDSTDDDGTPIRLLNVNGKFQSVCYVEPARRWDLACIYHQYFAQIVDIQRDLFEAGGTPEDAAEKSTPSTAAARQALVIGGGGYSFPKWLAANAADVSTTVVEIDPKVTKIARERFFLDEALERFGGRLDLVCDDGWGFLASSEKRFDVIVNDAFGGKRPLGPLKTDEGAAAVAAHLTERGVYLANVISPLEGPDTQVLDESVAACKSAFTHVYLIPECPEEPTTTGDNVLVASNAKLDIAAEYALG